MAEIHNDESYYERQERARQEAIEWQADFGNHSYSWGEIFEWCDYFTELGKRYGLLEEFRENGIL